MARKDYYSLLGVKRNASPDEIRKAFRDMAKQYHPDRNPNDADAERRFREVAEAWEVLGDAEQRSRYDRLGPLYTATGRPPSPEEMNEVLRDTFNSLLGRKKGSRPGEDIRFTATVTLEEAALGCERSLKIQRRVQCKDCAGNGDSPEGRQACGVCGGSGKSPTRRFLRTECANCDGKGYRATKKCERCGGEGLHGTEETIKVKVPPGVATGQKLKVKGKGAEGSLGGAAGDLYVILTIEDHPLFRRRGADLLCEVPVAFTDAALGVDLRVPTLDGSTTIRIPPGTPSGRSFRLPGRGMPGLGGAGRGDLHIKVSVEVPTKLSPEQRATLASFAERLGPDAHPQRKAWQELLARRKLPESR